MLAQLTRASFIYVFFSDDNLWLKHHIITHYVSLMDKIRPIINGTSFRFESRNRDFKQTAENINSRINPTLT